MESVVQPDNTLAILLGASDFPRYPSLGSNRAFANSAGAVREYLLDRDGLSLDPSHVLDLFDSEKSASEMHAVIADFLKSATASGRVTDLILYYVGHGDFVGPDKSYFLALRSTAEGLEGPSGLRMADLASTLRNCARWLRKYLILDCCFSAAAFKDFQSAAAEAARQQTLEGLPAKGTTLLCAASKSKPAVAPSGEIYTMFSGALRDVLRTGIDGAGSQLSLNEVGDRIKATVKERFPDSFVRPQVLSPEQAEGDIAGIGLFPNAAVKKMSSVVDIARLEARLRDLEIQNRELLQSRTGTERSSPLLDSPRPPAENATGARTGEARGRSIGSTAGRLVYRSKLKSRAPWVAIALVMWLGLLMLGVNPEFPIGGAFAPGLIAQEGGGTSGPEYWQPHWGFGALSTSIVLAAFSLLVLPPLIVLTPHRPRWWRAYWYACGWILSCTAGLTAAAVGGSIAGKTVFGVQFSYSTTMNFHAYSDYNFWILMGIFSALCGGVTAGLVQALLSVTNGISKLRYIGEVIARTTLIWTLGWTLNSPISKVEPMFLVGLAIAVVSAANLRSMMTLHDLRTSTGFNFGQFPHDAPK